MAETTVRDQVIEPVFRDDLVRHLNVWSMQGAKCGLSGLSRRDVAACASVGGSVQTGLVNEPKEQLQTLVLTDVRDDRGTMWRAVTLTEDGGLAILGQDLGQGVEQFWGCREYEFERRLSAAEVTTLRELLTVPAGGDLLAAIGERFPSTSDLERFAEDHGIVGEFWSRIGD